LSIYLDDGDASGNIYVTGPASATNWQATPSEPLNSLAEAFRAYDLEPGDMIYLDAGNYTNSSAATLGRLDSGNATNPVVLFGSTNACSGFSVLNRTTAASGEVLNLSNVRHVMVSNLVFQRATRGVVVSNGVDISFGQVQARSNLASGFEIVTSSNITFLRTASSFNGGHGVLSYSNQEVLVQNSVIYSNQGGGLLVQSGTMRVSNSVLTAQGTTGLVYAMYGNATIRSDYNNILVINNASVARSTNGLVSKTLTTWQQRTTNDLRALSHAPGFVNARAGDYHLLSEAGRFDRGTCGVVTDAVGTTSFLIDTGDPTSQYSNEPVENGSRINIGMYGNTAEASNSRTNGWLLVLTLNDGGTIRGTNGLYWAAGGAATGALVYIDFSGDGGVTWTNVATNFPAANGVLPVWDTTLYGSTLLGKWRITSQTVPPYSDTNDTPFTVDNGQLTFYVNDNSTNGDVYCTGPGSSANDGWTPATPALSVATIIANNEISPGYRILWDTGTYNLSSDLQLDANFQGDATNYIEIVGSTNLAAGGTLINRQSSGLSAIRILSTRGIMLSNLRITNAFNGIRVLNCEDLVFNNVQIHGMKGVFDASTDIGVNGFMLEEVTNAVFRGCSVEGVTNSSLSAALRLVRCGPISWLSGVLWSNKYGIRFESSGTLSVSNSVFASFGPGQAGIYRRGSAVTLHSDYNNFYTVNGAKVAVDVVEIAPILPLQTLMPLAHESLQTWIKSTGNDTHSLSHEPLFADITRDDYHLLSTAGRYQPGTGFVLDLQSSVLLDAGPPGWVATNEPAPNGGRINLGPHGNTPEASKSPATAALLAVTLNDGGVVSGTNQMLYWVASGGATSHLLSLQYSSDNGSNWVAIVSNLAAGVTSYNWNPSLFQASMQAKWRVLSETQPSLFDPVDEPFAMRTNSLVFYVNDASSSNDVYCSAAGSTNHSGLTPATPMASIQQVLDAYDLEGGDIVYIDTGSYSQSVNIAMSSQDSGGTNYVQFVGSTNYSAGGTVLRGHGFGCESVQSVLFRDIRIDRSPSPFGFGLYFQTSSNAVLERVSIKGGGVGVEFLENYKTVMNGCTIVGASTNGLRSFLSTETYFHNGVLWTNRTGVRSSSGNISISNSVLRVAGADRFIYDYSGTLRSDYNNILVDNGALMARDLSVIPNCSTSRFPAGPMPPGATCTACPTMRGSPMPTVACSPCKARRAVMISPSPIMSWMRRLRR
jgi:hypothetical protein